MRWRGERQSSNIEDRRGMSAGKVAVGGGLGTVLLLIVALIFGADPRQLLEGSGKYMRHVKVRPGVDIDKIALTTLIHSAYGAMKRCLGDRGSAS